jgi:hypothetical protein
MTEQYRQGEQFKELEKEFEETRREQTVQTELQRDDVSRKGKEEVSSK